MRAGQGTKRGPIVPEQRRGRVIAMSADELTSFLGEQRTCRFATTGPDGPHVAPVWFVWDGQALWVYSLTRSQRWANLARDPRVAVVVDDGHHYHELHGVEIEGQATVMGPVPRKGHEDCPELAKPAARVENFDVSDLPCRIAAQVPRGDAGLAAPQP